MKKVFYLSLVAIVASSCASGMWIPNAKNNFGTQTTVVLDKANFRVVRNIEAVVEVNNNDLKRGDVEKSAYAGLLKRANLTGSQVLINVIVDEIHRTSGFSVFRKTNQYVAARATVIEFLDDSGNPIPSVSVYAKPTETSKQTSNENDIDDYEIKIPSKTFRNAILSKVDTNQDGKITKSEVMSVTELNVASKRISDMRGIEEFENLTILVATNNSFRSIDLSNNKKLEKIWIASESMETLILSESLALSEIIVDIPPKNIQYK